MCLFNNKESTETFCYLIMLLECAFAGFGITTKSSVDAKVDTNNASYMHVLYINVHFPSLH